MAPMTPTTFLFGGTLISSLGTMDVRFPFADGVYARIRGAVVDTEVPLLLGLECFDAQGLYIKNIEDQLKWNKRGISTPLIHKNWHIYMERGTAVHCISLEFNGQHLHFAHPAAG